MRKTLINKSKKGFSLPLAMAISVFLVLISTSLIFVALSSLSSTSADIGGRQAYLNVKSALDYAQAYYSHNVSDYSSITEEYLIMNDPSGTTEQGAVIGSKTEAEAKTTYVVAQYQEAHDSDPATLKLTGFSSYSDAFGKKSKTVRLSVTFTIGSNTPNRLTVIAVPPKNEKSSSSERIVLNVKQPADMNYQLSYYVWTYRDKKTKPDDTHVVGNAYDSFYEDYAKDQNLISLEYDQKNVTSDFISNLNTSTVGKNEVQPNGVWGVNSGDKDGPPAVMSNRTANNAWITGDYLIDTDYVPWFNIIFAQKGSTIEKSGVYDSQTNEIFHLWYLDPSDKNIYFEFSGKKHKEGSKTYYTKYHEGVGWDGREGLEDTVLVYVKNMKSAVHFKAKGDDESASFSSITDESDKPVIVSVVNRDGRTINTSDKSYINAGENKKDSNIAMKYEGCGWWVANIESNSRVDLGIKYKGETYYVTASPNTSNDIWLAKNESGLTSHRTEAAAASAAGSSINKYVTVHAKVADYAHGASPTISYKNVAYNSSAGRKDLQAKIIKTNQLMDEDYEEAGMAVVHEKVNAATLAVNNDNFIKNQGTDDTPYAEKISLADAAYAELGRDIDTAVNALKPKAVTTEQLAPLDKELKKAENAISEQNKSGIYDYTFYAAFIADGSAYKVAENAMKDTRSLTASGITVYKNNLEAANNELAAHKLNREDLKNLIKEAEGYVNNEGYKQIERNALAAQLDLARAAVNEKFVSQSTIDDAKAALKTKLDACKAAIDVPYETADLQEIIVNAYNTLINASADYTDETYSALRTLYDSVETEKSKFKEQADVDAFAAKLQKAIDEFKVVKPLSSNDMLSQNNKFRIWVINNSDKVFSIDQYANAASSQPMSIPSVDLTPESSSGYYYFDIDKTLYTTVKVSLDNGTASDAYIFSEIAEGNLAVEIGADGKMTKKTLTSVYFPDSVGSKGTLTGLLDGKELTASRERGYYVFRYPTQNKKFTIKVAVTQMSGEQDVKLYNAGTLTAGDFVAQTDGTNLNPKIINASSIYPKSTAPAPENTPSGMVARSDDFVIETMSSAIPSAVRNISVPEGKTCISIDTSGSASDILSEGTPKAYIWNFAEQFSLNSQWKKADNQWRDRPEMRHISGTDYYYIICPSDLNGLKVTKTNSEFATKDIIIRSGEYDPMYKYVHLTSKATPGEFDVWREAYTSSSDDTPVDVTAEDLTTQFDDVAISDSQTCIILHVTNGASKMLNGNHTPKIYVWDDDFHALSAAWPGDLMLKYKNTNYYYYVTKSNVGGCKFAYESGANYTPDGDAYNIVIRTKSEDNYKYVVMEPVASYDDTTINITKKQSSAPAVVVEEESKIVAEADFDDDNIPLVYVGGNKVRLQNKSYSSITSDKKNSRDGTAITTSNPFGGSGGDQANNDSGGRLGLSETSAFYDWYDVKLPIPRGAEFTFELKSMGDVAGAKTVQVANAYDDIWLSQLDNTTIVDNRYSNVELLTFDPESAQITETLSVYFKLPSGWTDLTVEAHGVGSVFKKNTSEIPHLKRSKVTNYYVIKGISKNTPFITFSVKDSAGNPKTFKATLQGGDKVLYDPEADSGYGNWTTFVSGQEYLQRVLRNLMSTFYGNMIVGDYDEKGKVVNKDSKTYFYSAFLENTFKDYASKPSASASYYVLNDVQDMDEEEAYNKAQSLEPTLTMYTDIYENMSRAKSYLAEPIVVADRHNGGGVYPEYISLDNKSRTYSSGAISSIKKALKQAEDAYLSSTSDKITKANNALKRAIASTSVKSEGAIAIVLYDAQNKVKDGKRFKVSYDGQDEHIELKDRNPENYPIIFINTNDPIKNVQLYEVDEFGVETLLGSPMPEMKLDEAWVYVDSSNPYWSKNSVSDYREINTDIFSEYDENERGETVYEEMKFVMNRQEGKDTYEPMTLLFTRDVSVECRIGNYTIKAGAYYFKNESTFPVREGVLDVFSEDAKTYFTDPANYGAYTENAIDAASELGWYVTERDAHNFKTGVNRSAAKNVNFDATDGGDFTKYGIEYEYSSTMGFAFRWSNEEPLYTTTPVNFKAESFKFGAIGTIDGTENGIRDPKFTLGSESDADQMDITFMTDVTVKYMSSDGVEHQFVIREGEYTIKKDPDAEDTSYIANLYNETYWKGMTYVIPKGRGGTVNISSTGSVLSHPSYE